MRKSYHELDDEDLARIVHEAHLGLRISLNDSATDVHFDAMDQERKDMEILQVRMFREGKSLAEVHRMWVGWMRERGWTDGERNVAEKTHPNLREYDELDEESKAKLRQAYRIVFTHVMPDCLERIAYKDIRSRSWSEISEGPDFDIGAVVCTTHMRFVPCRRNDGTCAYSEEQADVDRVYGYQNE